MNQKVCPSCQHANSFEETFCTNCGRMLPTMNQTSSQRETPTVEYSNASATAAQSTNFAGQNQYQNPPKKSRVFLWLALLFGGVVMVFLIFALAGFGFYYYMGARNSNSDYNFNSASSNTNTATIKDTNSSNSDSKTLTDDEKYRLFYAASKVNDAELTLKVAKKIGIVDASGTPTADYDGFMTGMIGWAFTDTDFVQKLDTKQKALDYIDSNLPGISTTTKK